MKYLETGNEILGIKEYNLLGCRFLYRLGKNQKTIVTFSAFPPKDIAQKYNYIKDFIQSECTFLSFLDTELPEEDPRGTYYLSENLGTAYLTSIHSIISILSENSKENTYLLGSSKGAVAALLLGLKFNYPNIIVNAPQVFLADYIKRRSLSILSYMIGKNDFLKEINYHELNHILLESVKSADNSLNWNIHITCGQEDTYHLNQLAVLTEKFEQCKIPLITKIIRGGHDNLSIIDYRLYFSSLLQLNKEKEIISQN